MRLSEFIVQNVDRIVDEWEQFAQTITPAAHAMDSTALRDHAKDILLAASRDMTTAQSAREQQAKAEGEGPDSTPALDEAAASSTTATTTLACCSPASKTNTTSTTSSTTTLMGCKSK